MNPDVPSSLHKDQCLANGADLMGPCVWRLGTTGCWRIWASTNFYAWLNKQAPKCSSGLTEEEAEVLCSSDYHVLNLLYARPEFTSMGLTLLLLIPVHFEGSCPFWVTRSHVVSAASSVPFIIQVAASGSLRTASFHVCIFLCVLWRLCLARLFQ